MKTVVITGATSGIGLAVARAMLAAGWHVIGIGSQPVSCTMALEKIDPGLRQNIRFLAGDLMQQREVIRLAKLICLHLDENCDGRLDALINNAGCVRSWYATSEEGYEQQFALNHLAGFLLTKMFLPQLIKAHGRILFTGSGSHRGLDINWPDMMFKNHYRPLRAYKQSKLCNMLTALELNHRLTGTGVRAYVVDPGLVRTDIGNKKTGGLVSLVWTLRKRQGQHPDKPAQTYAWLCSQNPAPDGLYFYNCQKRAYSRYVTDESARRLFKLSEGLIL